MFDAALHRRIAPSRAMGHTHASAAARRTISIPSELADELSAQMKSLELTGADPEELLFPNNEGRPLDYSNWRRRVWEPAVNAAGLEGLNFHDLRRTNATAMVSPKESTSKPHRPDSDTPTHDSRWPSTPRQQRKAIARRRRNWELD